jgi:hypothetical protein
LQVIEKMFVRLQVIEKMLGAQLVGLKYKPLFPYFADITTAFRVISGTLWCPVISRMSDGSLSHDLHVPLLESMVLTNHVK